jgi:pilus assembly protein CpaE
MAQAVLVDIDPRPRQTLAELEPIIARFTNTRFIVLSTSRHDDLILEAMQIGARHFLVKQSIPEDLAAVLDRLIPKGRVEAGKEGPVLTVVSASGGCGATTLAVNLAEELRLMSSEPALLVDLDCHYGALATYLGVDGQYGLADVLADPARIDSQLISSTAVPYSEGLHVLMSPASTDLTGQGSLAFGHLGKAIESCRRTYGYTVIDAPRVPIEVAAGLAQASAVTMIVFQVSVKDIRFARSLRGALLERGASGEAIMLLANRYRKRHSMISVEDAEKALGGVGFCRIKDDFRSAIRGLNYGQPLSQAAPRSSLRREVRRMAVELTRVSSRNTSARASR